ncbi:MAG: phosphatase PAP2 family protein [Nitrososphaerales archaeon]
MLSADGIVSLRSVRFFVLVIIFIAISALVASGATTEFDESVTEAVVEASGNPAADAVVTVVTTSADLFPIYFSPMIIFSFILILRRKTRRIGAILLLILALSTFAYTQVKGVVDRERPPYEFKPNIGFDYEPERDVLSRFASSFPSGHATRSAAFALVVGYMLRNRSVGGVNAGMLMWAFPASIAFTRLYMGAHYPTDVIAGVLLGLIVANALGRILKFERPANIDRQESSR